MAFEDIHGEWHWARGLTVDLLNACSDLDLEFQLTENSGELWKQFRHIGRVHENYLTSIEVGSAAFDTASGSYSAGNSKADLLSYFETLQAQHQTTMASVSTDTTIDWFGESVSLELHLTRLLAHETLHHGQLILYWRALGNEFPKSWGDWGQ